MSTSSCSRTSAANFAVNWGDSGTNGLVSVEYTFKGESAHAGNAPWRGRSALDAVELMDVGWNFRREHLRIQQRSHSVITNGGDQPNVVPLEREPSGTTSANQTTRISRKCGTSGIAMSQAAAMMTDTEVSCACSGRRGRST